ncbi:unnamed protein product [Adineta steineri]|uniref:Uncharacterized protein n=2 Tax=Adineta steineri TaxID=433720 RepID=A0A815QII5_9BILA|nr:unnamed protein product [Adineta steineri]
MARTKQATYQSKITTATDGQKTRLPLALKPTSNTTLVSHLTAMDQPLSKTSNNANINSTFSKNSSSSNMTTDDGTSQTSSITNQTRLSTTISSSSKTITASSYETELASTLVKGKKGKTKTKSKAKIIDCELNLKDNNQNDDDAHYDLRTSIEESGGIHKFLNTPCMILYKKNLKNQSDIEKYVLQHLTSYKENLCEFPGITGTDQVKKSINDFYRRYRKTSMHSTILYKANTKKTTSTQQIYLKNGTLYLYVDNVMKLKTSKNKKQKVPSYIGTASARGNSDDMKNDENDSEPYFDEASDEEIEEINASTSGTRKRFIQWKGGSKNCGTYVYYNKFDEVKECVNNILSYGREHGTLLSGVQLKTLMDIENVEITKDRANVLVKLVSSCVDVVPNPHFVSPTAKRPVYEYYGSEFQLAVVESSKSIPIPTEILAQYKREKEKENVGDRHEKSYNSHETEDNDFTNDDINMKSHTVISSSVINEEVVINDNISLSLIHSTEDNNSKTTDNDNVNVDVITKQVETPATSLITSSSPLVRDKIDYSNTTDTTASDLELLVHDSKQSATSSLPLSSVAPEVSSCNQTSSATVSHSNPHHQSNSVEYTTEDEAPLQERMTPLRSNSKAASTANVRVKRVSSKRRQSIALRSKTKMKQQQQQQQQLSDITHSKRKEDDDEEAAITLSITSKKKKKLNGDGTSAMSHQTLPKISKKKPKPLK